MMVVVKGPLMSLGASGALADAIVFSRWKGRPYVRKHVIPANPQSGLQVGLREVFRFITQDFTNLSASDIADWNALAGPEAITDLNAHVADAIELARRNLGWRENTTDADPAQIDAATGGSATAQPKTLVLSWSDPAANIPDYCWAIYRSTSSGFTPDVSNLVGVVKYDVHEFTDRDLLTGTTYYYRTRGVSTSGMLGTLDTEFSGTPT